MLQRLGRAVSVPAVIGVLLFLVAVVVTGVVMLRGLSGEADADAASFVSDGILSGAGTDAPGTPGTPGTPGCGDGTAGLLGVGAGAAAAEGGPAQRAAAVVVHLVGEVRDPGVVELEPGARVLDAIAAAGGATDLADLTVLNLARLVSDGEQIQVFDRETAAQLREEGAIPAPAAHPDSGAGSGSAAGTGAAAPGGHVSINSASAEQLTALSGIGPALAQRIIEWREAHGRFESVDQLLEVSGIGAKTLEKFRDSVSL